MMVAMESRLAVIDGLRGVAIIGVLWHHTVYKLWLQSDGVSQLQGPLAAVLNSGWLGVNLFFVLSGFVLYLPYAMGRRECSTLDSWIYFYKRRAVRLLPLYYLSLLAFGALDWALGTTIAPSQLLSYLSLSFVFRTDTFLPQPNWVLWSLGVEIWFSLLFPVLVHLTQRHGITRVLIATLALSLAVRVAGTLPELFEQGDRLNAVKDGVLGRLDDFVLGMWICHAYARRQLSGSRSMIALVAVGLFIGLLSCIGWERVFSASLPLQVVPLLHNGIQCGAGALLVAALVLPGRWAWLLTNRPMQLTGMMCFSLYVWHGRPIETLLGPTFDAARFGLYLALVAGIAALSYRFIEFPRVRIPALTGLGSARPVLRS
jgi:peptidoglycan/LPS O-acetylase OafA/YrhL